MKNKGSLFLCAWFCLAVAGSATAETYLAEGPYAADKRTVVLFHFDEAAGASRPQDGSFHAHNPYAGPLATGDEGVFGNAMAFTNSLMKSLTTPPSSTSSRTASSNAGSSPPRITSIAGEATTRSSIKTREAATAETSASASG